MQLTNDINNPILFLQIMYILHVFNNTQSDILQPQGAFQIITVT
jgi:hypothetical protein